MKKLLLKCAFVLSAAMPAAAICYSPDGGNVSGKYIADKNGTGHFEITFNGDVLVGGPEIVAGIADQTVTSGTYRMDIISEGSSTSITLTGNDSSISVPASSVQITDDGEKKIEVTDSAQGKQKVSIYQNGTRISFIIY